MDERDSVGVALAKIHESDDSACHRFGELGYQGWAFYEVASPRFKTLDSQCSSANTRPPDHIHPVRKQALSRR